MNDELASNTLFIPLRSAIELNTSSVHSNRTLRHLKSDTWRAGNGYRLNLLDFSQWVDAISVFFIAKLARFYAEVVRFYNIAFDDLE